LNGFEHIGISESSQVKERLIETPEKFLPVKLNGRGTGLENSTPNQFAIEVIGEYRPDASTAPSGASQQPGHFARSWSPEIKRRKIREAAEEEEKISNK